MVLRINFSSTKLIVRHNLSTLNQATQLALWQFLDLTLYCDGYLPQANEVSINVKRRSSCANGQVPPVGTSPWEMSPRERRPKTLISNWKVKHTVSTVLFSQIFFTPTLRTREGGLISWINSRLLDSKGLHIYTVTNSDLRTPDNGKSGDPWIKTGDSAKNSEISLSFIFFLVYLRWWSLPRPTRNGGLSLNPPCKRTSSSVGCSTGLVYCTSMDRIHKWRRINCPFVFMLIFLTSLVSM